MNREKLAWSVSAVMLAVLAFQMPSSLSQRDDDMTFVRTLADIHRRVDDNYVDPVDEARLDRGAIDGMLAQLDPYSVYVPPEREADFDRMLTGNFKGVGIQLAPRPDGTFEVVTPLDGSPAAASGIEPGDVLLAVDGKPLAHVQMPDVIRMVGGAPKTTVALSVRHLDGTTATYTLVRDEVHTPTVRGYRRRADNSWDFSVCQSPLIGYARLTQFTGDSHDELRTAIDGLLAAGARGLILDLRFNPGGELEQAERIVNMFVPAGRTILTTRGLHRPERRDVSDGVDVCRVAGRDLARGVLPDLPLIVLVNEHSASAAEIVSGSLKDNGRAVVLGQRTFGKGSVQDRIPLPEKGGELKLTIAHYYLPSGRLVHRLKDATDWGVEPQIVVPMGEEAQLRLLRQQEAAEVFRRPTTTRPAAAEPTSRPSDDVQLEAAVNTMLGILVFRSEATTRP
jgi:carboxyl-terminal processing protease